MDASVGYIVDFRRVEILCSGDMQTYIILQIFQVKIGNY